MDPFARLAALRARAAGKPRRRAATSGSPREVPPGQILVEKWPVLTAGPIPRIELDTWTLSFSGLVDNPFQLSHPEVLALPRKKLIADFHCVTSWSRLDNEWEGASLGDLIEKARPRPEAKFAMVLCYGGYTTNLPLEALLDDDVLLAFRHDGEDLTPGHGWPLRLVVPSRYGWKSAKWVRQFDFMDEDEPGFWEVRGYHNDGDPWTEERYSI